MANQNTNIERRQTFEEMRQEEREQSDKLEVLAKQFSSYYGFLDAVQGPYGDDAVGPLTIRTKNAASWIEHFMIAGEMPISWLIFNMTSQALAGLIIDVAYDYRCNYEDGAKDFLWNLYNWPGNYEWSDYAKGFYITNVEDSLQQLRVWRANKRGY